jgi:hypothetical protein
MLLFSMMMFFRARSQILSFCLACAGNQNNKLFFDITKERVLAHKNFTVTRTLRTMFWVSFFFVGLVSMRVELINMVLLTLNSHYYHHQLR